jgi:hypothetical protein
MNVDCTRTFRIRRFRVAEIASATTLLAAYWFFSQPAADAGTIFASQNLSPGTVFAISPAGAKTPYAPANDEVTSMAVDPAGNLFFAESIGVGTILKRTPAGVQTTFTTVGGSVYGMACDASGALYAASGSSIYKFSSTGVRTLFAADNNDPAWLAFGPDGSLMVLDRASPFGMITKFSPSGVSSVFASNIRSPRAFAVDGNGNVFVEATNDQLGQEIFKYSPSGIRAHFAIPPEWPWSFAVDPTSNQLFGAFGPNANFSDASELIYKFDSNGNAMVVTQVPYALSLTGSPVPEPSGVVLAFGAVVSACMLLKTLRHFRNRPVRPSLARELDSGEVNSFQQRRVGP